MRYLMLVCRDVDDSPAPPTQADRDGAPDVGRWWQEVSDAGKYVTGDRLRPAAEAMTVRVRRGEVLVTQGPFTEAREVVAARIYSVADIVEARGSNAFNDELGHAALDAVHKASADDAVRCIVITGDDMSILARVSRISMHGPRCVRSVRSASVSLLWLP